MKKWLKKVSLLWLLLPASVALAGPVFIWYGDYAKNLATGGMVLGGTDEKQVADLSTNPTSGGGVAAPVGSVGLYNNSGTGVLYIKTGAADTAWSAVSTSGSGASTWVLTGNSDLDGTNFLGSTNPRDLIFKTNNTERFRISSSGAYDTTLSTGILHSDSSGILTSSATDLASADVTGVLALANGGTNSALTAANGGVAYSGASGLGITAAGTAGYILTSTGANAPVWAPAAGIGGSVVHATLSGLSADDHTQYALLAGRSGGQTLTGGTAASNSLIIRSTSDGTKGQVYLDETTASSSTTTGALRVGGGVGVGNSVYIAKGLNVAGDFASAIQFDSTASPINALSTTDRSNIKITTSGATTLNGIAGGYNGKTITIINGTGALLTISNNSGSAAATDKIINSTGTDYTLNNGGITTLTYDATGGWRNRGGIFDGPAVSTDTGVAIFNGTSGHIVQSSSCSIATGSNKPITCPGVGASSEIFGSGATAAGIQGTAIGNGSVASNSGTTCVGYSCLASGLLSTGYGAGTNASGTYAFSMGYLATASGTGAIRIGALGAAGADYSNVLGYSSTITGARNQVLGANSNSASADNILLGDSITSTAPNQFIVGSSTSKLTNFYFGQGISMASPQSSITIKPTGGSGSNSNATSLILTAGTPTGNAYNASNNIISIQTPHQGPSGAVSQTLIERLLFRSSSSTASGQMGFGEAVFNDGQSSYSLRIASSGSSTLIFTDAVNNQVGILKANPQAKLDVAGDFKGTVHGKVFGTAGAPISVTAAGGITSASIDGSRSVVFVQGSGGAVDITVNPQIAAGSTVGQELVVIGESDTNTVLLEDGNGLSLNGSALLGDEDVISFLWDGTNWLETSRR